MAYYKDDRNFTDMIHKLAVEKIYPLMSWVEAPQKDKELQEYMDNTDAIDYEVIDANNNTLYVQERFRRYGYNDITLRYEREYSKYEREKKSEYYKIKDKLLRDKTHNFYFLYGITDKKVFEKYVIIDLRKLFNLIENGNIIIDINKAKFSSYIENSVLYAGYNENKDKSSCFIAFDIKHLSQYDGVVLIQKGFDV